jgi:long-chain acyl-CoA synthetase
VNFLEHIFRHLRETADQPVLQEVRSGGILSVTGAELLAMIRTARAYLRRQRVRPGDRCALLAPNSIRWVALDLALMAEGIIVVPLYIRQTPTELVHILRDCSPALLCCENEELRERIRALWPEAPPMPSWEEIFAPDPLSSAIPDMPLSRADSDPVTIIYTSGTSGDPKGVVLTIGNVTFMLPHTHERLDRLMGRRRERERVFHYLPFCFAGSWILLLTCLSRPSVLALSTDLTRLQEEIHRVRPHYFLNVPILLERMRAGIEEQITRRGRLVSALFQRGEAAWLRHVEGQASLRDYLWMALARPLFRAIRARLGSQLVALICGSAPLRRETQLFFLMLGLPVLQVYGLTETTAICTMDDPQDFTPGRVGRAIPGIEMTLSDTGEILVRGPNVFPGYWNRPEATAQVFREGWFCTGDHGEVDEQGNWSILGRVKHLIVLSSGHNVPPEPLEDKLLHALPGAQHVVLVGHGRPYLAALITGAVTAEQVEAVLDSLNAELPHYQRIRAYALLPEPFTVENGLLTANGKLRREAILARFHAEIERLYAHGVPTRS